MSASGKNAKRKAKERVDSGTGGPPADKKEKESNWDMDVSEGTDASGDPKSKYAADLMALCQNRLCVDDFMKMPSGHYEETIFGVLAKPAMDNNQLNAVLCGFNLDTAVVQLRIEYPSMMFTHASGIVWALRGVDWDHVQKRVTVTASSAVDAVQAIDFNEAWISAPNYPASGGAPSGETPSGETTSGLASGAGPSGQVVTPIQVTFSAASAMGLRYEYVPLRDVKTRSPKTQITVRGKIIRVFVPEKLKRGGMKQEIWLKDGKDGNDAITCYIWKKFLGNELIAVNSVVRFVNARVNYFSNKWSLEIGYLAQWGKDTELVEKYEGDDFGQDGIESMPLPEYQVRLQDVNVDESQVFTSCPNHTLDGKRGNVRARSDTKPTGFFCEDCQGIIPTAAVDLSYQLVFNGIKVTNDEKIKVRIKQMDLSDLELTRLPAKWPATDFPDPNAVNWTLFKKLQVKPVFDALKFQNGHVKVLVSEVDKMNDVHVCRIIKTWAATAAKGTKNEHAVDGTDSEHIMFGTISSAFNKANSTDSVAGCSASPHQ